MVDNSSIPMSTKLCIMAPSKFVCDCVGCSILRLGPLLIDEGLWSILAVRWSWLAHGSLRPFAEIGNRVGRGNLFLKQPVQIQYVGGDDDVAYGLNRQLAKPVWASISLPRLLPPALVYGVTFRNGPWSSGKLLVFST